MSNLTAILINDLVITGTNARRDHVADKAMIASLQSQGLLYPLLVEPVGDGNYEVVDGARRLTCIREGIASGELSGTVFAYIPCLVSNGDGRKLGLEQSLHANLHMAMHPLDECEAILKLSEDEPDAAAIGLRFGQDEKWVHQRAKLANLADEVKDIFRGGAISLNAAIAFTLGSHALQKAFLKKHKGDFTYQMIRPAMTEAAISAKDVNFNVDNYPAAKIQRDLFSEEVYLLDRALVGTMQDQWAQEEVQRLKDEGYDEVICLKPDDWQTLNAHVAVTGKIKPADKARLKCFLKATPTGLIQVYEGMALRKHVDDKGKIKKQAHQADETPVENIKPTACTELSIAQQEVVNAHAAAWLYAKVVEGDELLAQFLMVDSQFGIGGWTANSPAFNLPSIKRWQQLKKSYPSETLIHPDNIHPWDENDKKPATFADFAALPKKQRDHLYRLAVASTIIAPYGQQKLEPNLMELGKHDWFHPGEDFFKRFRKDQLIDYLKRSGDKTAVEDLSSKDQQVQQAITLARDAKSFKFGLYEKKK